MLHLMPGWVFRRPLSHEAHFTQSFSSHLTQVRASFAYASWAAGRVSPLHILLMWNLALHLLQLRCFMAMGSLHQLHLAAAGPGLASTSPVRSSNCREVRASVSRLPKNPISSFFFDDFSSITLMTQFEDLRSPHTPRGGLGRCVGALAVETSSQTK